MADFEVCYVFRDGDRVMIVPQKLALMSENPEEFLRQELVAFLKESETEIPA